MKLKVPSPSSHVKMQAAGEGEGRQWSHWDKRIVGKSYKAPFLEARYAGSLTMETRLPQPR